MRKKSSRQATDPCLSVPTRRQVGMYPELSPHASGYTWSRVGNVDQVTPSSPLGETAASARLHTLRHIAGVISIVVGLLVLVALITQITDQLEFGRFEPTEYFAYFTIQTAMINIVVLYMAQQIGSVHNLLPADAIPSPCPEKEAAKLAAEAEAWRLARRATADAARGRADLMRDARAIAEAINARLSGQR